MSQLPTLNQQLNQGGFYPGMPGHGPMPNPHGPPPQQNWNQQPGGYPVFDPHGGFPGHGHGYGHGHHPHGNWNQYPQENQQPQQPSQEQQPPQGNQPPYGQQPAYQPQQPQTGYQPQPGYPPQQPQPGYQPPQPGYPPQQPQPGYQPPQPGYPPQQPQTGYQPQQPQQGYQPSQPGYPPQQPQQSQPGYPPQQSQQSQPGYQPQPAYAQPQYQPYQYGFAGEIRDMKNRYKMNFPDDQIDNSLEEAKNKKRMYPFPEPETNYVKYDQNGKSYIASTHGFPFAHSDNKQYYDTRNDSNSYDGTAKHLIKVCLLSVKFKFNHVKPGNYKLFLNQCFEEEKIKGQLNFRIFVCDKEIFCDNQFPNDDMVKRKQLSEYYVRDIKREDFDMSKLDQNGDGIIRIEFGGNDGKSWKKGWTIDGARLQCLDEQSQGYSQPGQGFPPQQQPAYAQQQGFPPQQQPAYAQQQGYPGYYPQYPGYQQYGFAGEIRDMKNRYKMNFPDDQIDNSLEEAKSKKRMYPFPEPETNYVKYDQNGKSYIIINILYIFYI